MTPILYIKNQISLRIARKEFTKNLGEEAMDIFLQTLLRLMDVYFTINKDFRKNIENFDARYAFRSKDGKIDVSAIFADSKMKVRNQLIPDTNITVVFRDSKAIKNFLFTESPDIINAMMNNEVEYTGNLNYLAKFAYMAKSLKMHLIPAK